MATAPQSFPHWLRAWALTLTTGDGSQYLVSSDQFSEALRVTFSVEMRMMVAYWQAVITIYNLSSEITQKAIQGAPNLQNLWQYNQNIVVGNTVSLSAGYKQTAAGQFNASASQLYSGKVLQPVWTRENVVDYKLVLRCVTGLFEDFVNFTSLSFAGGTTFYDALQGICAGSKLKIPIDPAGIDPTAQKILQGTKLPGNQVFHDKPYTHIAEIAKQNGLWSWIGPNGLNMRSFGPSDFVQPAFAYGPPDIPASYQGPTTGITVRNTLIGTPQQTKDGVMFRVLLDKDIKIGSVVQLAPWVLVNPFPLTINSYPAVPSRNGMYIVAGVRHVGDTRGRGEDWYTEVTGYTQDFFADWLYSRYRSIYAGAAAGLAAAAL